jgi:hypothetical protein
MERLTYQIGDVIAVTGECGHSLAVEAVHSTQRTRDGLVVDDCPARVTYYVRCEEPSCQRQYTWHGNTDAPCLLPLGDIDKGKLLDAMKSFRDALIRATHGADHRRHLQSNWPGTGADSPRR